MQKRIRLLGVALVLLASLTACTTVQPDTAMPQNDTKTDVHEQTAYLQPAEQVSAAEANSNPVSVILGRPTASEITVSILTRVSAQVTLQWGETSGAYTNKSDPVVCDGVDPAVFVLDGLKANTRYYYQVGWQADGKELVLLDEASFHTARATGETYQFVIPPPEKATNRARRETATRRKHRREPQLCRKKRQRRRAARNRSVHRQSCRTARLHSVWRLTRTGTIKRTRRCFKHRLQRSRR